jgi:hypothetical protein
MSDVKGVGDPPLTRAFVVTGRDLLNCQFRSLGFPRDRD